jgi:hypothetical protein
MNKKTLTLLISGAIVGTALSAYWYTTTLPEERKVIRKLRYVEPKVPQKNPLKSQQAIQCPEKRLKTLRVLSNGNEIWRKTHEELFEMDQVIYSEEKRLKGTNQIIPLTSLIPADTKIVFIDVTDCKGITKNLSIKVISQPEFTYYLGLNRKGWLKVMRKDERARYTTYSKAVIEINLREQ